MLKHKIKKKRNLKKKMYKVICPKKKKNHSFVTKNAKKVIAFRI